MWIILRLISGTGIRTRSLKIIMSLLPSSQGRPGLPPIEAILGAVVIAAAGVAVAMSLIFSNQVFFKFGVWR